LSRVLFLHTSRGRVPDQDPVIRVDGGFHPEEITVAWAQPVRLTFRRGRSRSPAGIVFPDLGRMVTLPATGDVCVELELEPGRTYVFLGMGGAPLGRVIVAELERPELRAKTRWGRKEVLRRMAHLPTTMLQRQAPSLEGGRR